MNIIISITKRNLKEIFREPISLIFLIGLPIVMQVLFYYMFHQLTAQFEMKYLAPGMIGFANAFLALFLAILVSTDRETAFITRIYTTPVTSYQFILAYVFAVIPLGLCQSAVILLVGGIIEPTFLSLNLLLIIPASLLSIITFASLGILFGSLFSTKAVGGICSILISGQSILSGMWFPLEGMSSAFIAFMNALPFKNVSTLFQVIATPSLIDSAFNDLWLPIIIILVYAILSTVLSCIAFVKNSKSK